MFLHSNTDKMCLAQKLSKIGLVKQYQCFGTGALCALARHQCFVLSVYLFGDLTKSDVVDAIDKKKYIQLHFFFFKAGSSLLFNGSMESHPNCCFGGNECSRGSKASASLLKHICIFQDFPVQIL